MARRRGPDAEAPARAARILVVDDEPNAAELLVRVLRSAPHGWTVERARDQAELADRLEPGGIDAVVIDMVANGVGAGIKLLDSIRGSHDRATAALPVVLVSSTPSAAMFSWQAGADGVLTRPFHARELIETVAAAIARPERERSAYRRERIAAT